MNKNALFGLMAKTSIGEDFLYRKIYENLSKGMQAAYGDLELADSKDFHVMIPNGTCNVYIHMPFCDTYCRSCPYAKSADLKIMSEYCDNLVREIELVNEYKGNRVIDPGALFMGGGTPSIVPIESMKKIAKALKDNIIKDKNVEMTLEANPKSTTEEKVEKWAEMGFNRISLGVQSFNENTLKYYNRNHGPDVSERICRHLTKIGFNYNADLLYGHDGEKLEDFTDDVKKIIDIGAPHVTLYPYFDKMPTKKKYLEQKKFYEAGQALLKSNGYEQYSIFDYYNKNGSPSKYMSLYRGSIALGAGATGSSIDNGPYAKISDVKTYNSYISQCKAPLHKAKKVEKERAHILRFYWLKLYREEFKSIFGDDPYEDQKEMFDMLEAIGHVEVKDDYIELKNEFRGAMLFTLGLFVEMMEPLRKKNI